MCGGCGNVGRGLLSVLGAGAFGSVLLNLSGLCMIYVPISRGSGPRGVFRDVGSANTGLITSSLVQGCLLVGLSDSARRRCCGAC